LKSKAQGTRVFAMYPIVPKANHLVPFCFPFDPVSESSMRVGPKYLFLSVAKKFAMAI